MKEQDFVFKPQEVVTGSSSWESPSNIALIKYWGKYGVQLPKNPSICFTLSQCKSITKINFRPKDESENHNFSLKILVHKNMHVLQKLKQKMLIF